MRLLKQFLLRGVHHPVRWCHAEENATAEGDQCIPLKADSGLKCTLKNFEIHEEFPRRTWLKMPNESYEEYQHGQTLDVSCWSERFASSSSEALSRLDGEEKRLERKSRLKLHMTERVPPIHAERGSSFHLRPPCSRDCLGVLLAYGWILVAKRG